MLWFIWLSLHSITATAMKKAIIVTPVKNSIELTLLTIESVVKWLPEDSTYTIYNDFSTDECRKVLEDTVKKYGINLVNLEDITTHPSPNYRLVLQESQKKAISEGADLIIVESDVIVKNDTIAKLRNYANEHRGECGIIAAITTDNDGEINYPYVFAKKHFLKQENVPTKKHVSFCCSLLTNELLSSYNFEELDPQKSWYDVHISQVSREIGLKNILLCEAPVIHEPHGSRPHKKLKKTNPLKYYWNKITKHPDRI